MVARSLYVHDVLARDKFACLSEGVRFYVCMGGRAHEVTYLTMMYGIILNYTLLYDNIRYYFIFYLHRRKNRGAERVWLDYWLLRTVIRIRVGAAGSSCSKYRILNT